MITRVIFLVLLPSLGVVEGTECCAEVVSNRSCYRVCQQLTFDPSLPGHQLDLWAQVLDLCPGDLSTFWQCINNTFLALAPGDFWPGRYCCNLLFDNQCRNACNRAHSKDELTGLCKKHHEVAFFNCLDRQEVSVECCGPATSSQCQAVCKAIFLEASLPSTSQREAVAKYCDSHVATCIQNYTKGTPGNDPTLSLPCCDHTNNVQCQSTCRQTLRTLAAEDEIIDEIVKACGMPSLADPLWQCFLRKSSDVRPQDNSGGTIETAGIDGAKLLCCTKSKTSTCRNLCVKTYSRGWTNSWNRFDRECAYHPMEADLNLCLQEVDQPCKMGCEGLQYCSNYNSRPTELFRSCSAQADRAARGDVQLWGNGTIRLPLMDDIPVKDISQCQPEMWKAIACTLQIKPCHRQAHTTSICRADCIRILAQCVDWSKVPASQTAEGLCNILSPAQSSQHCIPLHHYMVPNAVDVVEPEEIVQPCNPNPCEESEVCLINTRKCKHEQNCKAHVCKPACPVGEVSSMMVVRNSYVRIPEAESDMTCYKTCKCGHHNSLTRCTRTGCIRADSCLMGSGRIQAHNSHFILGCSQCSCFAGELICQERHCLNTGAPLQDRRRYTGLPCNCPNSYLPVCDLNTGRTYPSACIARCLGLKDFQFEIGSCSNQRACDRNPCNSDAVCIPRRQVCLGSNIRCPQYECVVRDEECNHRHHPVCDRRQQEFSNMCLLLHHKRSMAYWGHCQTGCSNTDVVCGQDGETYPNECAAWASGVHLDYYGHCRSVGHLTVNGVDPVCADIPCPERNVKNCRMITPPGACCPICAGEIRLLYSSKQADKVAATEIIPPVSLGNITSLLSQQLAVAHCGVFAYLSIEKDIVVIVAPTRHNPSLALVRACLTEAERLGSLLKLGSPIVMSHLVMTPVVSAHTRVAYFRTGAAALQHSSATLTVVAAILLHIIHTLCR